MGVEWEQATEGVIKLAQVVIEENHFHLLDARIGFLFRSEPGSSMGREIWGKASKVPARLQAFLEFDFIIWFAKPTWLGFLPEQKTALMDHELCHCSGDYEDGWSLRGHDIEEFQEIIDRHGIWRPSLLEISKSFKIAKQLKLEGVEFSGFLKPVPEEQLAFVGEAAGDNDDE